jgi:hypothetical protein
MYFDRLSVELEELLYELSQEDSEPSLFSRLVGVI